MKLGAVASGGYDDGVRAILLAVLAVGALASAASAAPAAPGFRVHLLDSQRVVDSRELIGKKVLVLRFQASYCKPCARESAALTRLAVAVLRPGGVLVQASCSSRVKSDQFFETVLAAAPLREIRRTGHPVDHPITFEQGAYLKALFAKTGAHTTCVR